MKFFEVFDMLTVDAGLKSVFEEVAAVKVAASKLSGRVTVHIDSKLSASGKEYRSP